MGFGKETVFVAADMDLAARSSGRRGLDGGGQHYHIGFDFDRPTAQQRIRALDDQLAVLFVDPETRPRMYLTSSSSIARRTNSS